MEEDDTAAEDRAVGGTTAEDRAVGCFGVKEEQPVGDAAARSAVRVAATARADMFVMIWWRSPSVGESKRGE